jgi:hypothetical protein
LFFVRFLLVKINKLKFKKNNLTETKLNQEKEERSAVSDVWTQQDAQSMMNYYMESPMMPDNNATFVFDDELFLAYWNSFLFESIGWVWRVGAWERWLVC